MEQISVGSQIPDKGQKKTNLLVHRSSAEQLPVHLQLLSDHDIPQLDQPVVHTEDADILGTLYMPHGI